MGEEAVCRVQTPRANNTRAYIVQIQIRARSKSTIDPSPPTPPLDVQNDEAHRTVIIILNYMRVDSHLLAGIGPHLASFLNVHSLLMSSKYNPDGQRFTQGQLSTHSNKTKNTIIFKCKVNVHVLVFGRNAARMFHRVEGEVPGCELWRSRVNYNAVGWEYEYGLPSSDACSCSHRGYLPDKNAYTKLDRRNCRYLGLRDT